MQKGFQWFLNLFKGKECRKRIKRFKKLKQEALRNDNWLWRPILLDKQRELKEFIELKSGVELNNAETCEKWISQLTNETEIKEVLKIVKKIIVAEIQKASYIDRYLGHKKWEDICEKIAPHLLLKEKTDEELLLLAVEFGFNMAMDKQILAYVSSVEIIRLILNRRLIGSHSLVYESIFKLRSEKESLAIIEECRDLHFMTAAALPFLKNRNTIMFLLEKEKYCSIDCKRAVIGLKQTKDIMFVLEKCNYDPLVMTQALASCTYLDDVLTFIDAGIEQHSMYCTHLCHNRILGVPLSPIMGVFWPRLKTHKN